MKCNGNCTKVLLKDPQLLKIIKSFNKEINSIKCDEVLLKNFYEYISSKYRIECEIGMIVIERSIFTTVYKRTNSLIRDKIKLFFWIEPVHLGLSLDINNKNFRKAVSLIKVIKRLQSVSEMINKYLEVVDCIYLTVGRSCEHSTFFSTLIISILKSQEFEIDLIVNFIDKFRRNKYKDCVTNCYHTNLLVENPCGCLELKSCEDSEVNFYLTVLKASLEFIEKIEFYNLNISKEEFNSKINS